MAARHPTLGLCVLLLALGLAKTPGTSQQVSPVTCREYTVTTSAALGKDGPSGRRATIRRGSQVVQTIDDWLIDTVTCVDVTGDGKDELVVETFSGGTHCCFRTLIFSLHPTFRSVLQYAGGNAGGFRLVHKAPGRLVVVLGDDGLAYFADLCFACSPSYFPFPACFRNGQFGDCTREHPELIEATIAEYRTALKEALRITDTSRLQYVRGAALGIFAGHALLQRESQGLLDVRRISPDTALRNWLMSHRADVRRWASSRTKRLTP